MTAPASVAATPSPSLEATETAPTTASVLITPVKLASTSTEATRPRAVPRLEPSITALTVSPTLLIATDAAAATPAVALPPAATAAATPPASAVMCESSVAVTPTTPPV